MKHDEENLPAQLEVQNKEVGDFMKIVPQQKQDEMPVTDKLKMLGKERYDKSQSQKSQEEEQKEKSQQAQAERQEVEDQNLGDKLKSQI